MGKRVTRRQLVRGIAVLVACWGSSVLRRAFGGGVAVADEEPVLTPRVYLPLVCSRYPPIRIAHVRSAQATYWDFSTGWYGSAVRQDVVDDMMERGLMLVTDTASVAGAWQALMPSYQPGQKIAVKVNFNNASCGDGDNSIDALIEPVNALIRSLVAAGIREDDVWVYDALRPMPARFYGRCRHTQARYFDSAGCADERATFNREDGSLRVTFSHPAMRTSRWLTDLLYRASYVINMPILKRHGAHPVTLGFKNHFGSLNNLGGGGNDNPHPYIRPNDDRYSPSFSPLVDIYANPNIAGKTVLTVADGLFGAPSVGAVPIRWTTFGNEAPNSLLLSRDPVAIDCVMCDLLRAEWGLNEAAYDYLRLAQARGLGVFERGEPWGSGYAALTYTRIDL